MLAGYNFLLGHELVELGFSYDSLYNIYRRGNIVLIFYPSLMKWDIDINGDRKRVYLSEEIIDQTLKTIKRYIRIEKISEMGD